MSPDEITDVLAEHGLWLAGEPQGRRANLTGANLTGANLYGANLARANLYGAKLRVADVDGVHLDRAIIPVSSLRVVFQRPSP